MTRAAAQGMGIAASKVACYTAFGGIDPNAALPVTIDAGARGRTQWRSPRPPAMTRRCGAALR